MDTTGLVETLASPTTGDDGIEQPEVGVVTAGGKVATGLVANTCLLRAKLVEQLSFFWNDLYLIAKSCRVAAGPTGIFGASSTCGVTGDIA